MTGEKWTEEDVQILTVMWEARAASGAIAFKLGRSDGAVRDKAGRLGLGRRNSTRGNPKPKTKYESELSTRPTQNLTKQAQRKCLGLECGGKMFLSDGYGHRLCPRCKSSTRVQESSQEWHHVHKKRGAAL